jgi:hypothetical protein
MLAGGAVANVAVSAVAVSLGALEELLESTALAKPFTANGTAIANTATGTRTSANLRHRGFDVDPSMSAMTESPGASPDIGVSSEFSITG